MSEDATSTLASRERSKAADFQYRPGKGCSPLGYARVLAFLTLTELLQPGSSETPAKHRIKGIHARTRQPLCAVAATVRIDPFRLGSRSTLQRPLEGLTLCVRKQSLSRNRCLSARNKIRSYLRQALAAYNLSWKPSATKGKQLADAERAEAAGSRVSLQHPQNTTAGCCFYRQSWRLSPTIILSDSRGAKAVLPLIAACPFSPAGPLVYQLPAGLSRLSFLL